MALKTLPIAKLRDLRSMVDASINAKIIERRRELELELSKLAGYEDRQGGRRKLGRGGKGISVAPKYRNPENPAETWAGRGLKPRWLAGAIKSGQKLDDFLIAKAADNQERGKATRKHKASLPRAHIAGQFIVRFKRGVVEDMARRSPPRSPTSRAVEAAMPEEVAGPLDALNNEAGLISVRPLFVTAAKAPARQPGPMRLAAARALAKSATEAPRESLRGFQLVEVKDKLSPGLFKTLSASKAVEFVEPVPNRWLSAALDPSKNRQWGLRAIRWFDGKHPDAAKVDVAVLDSGVDQGHNDLKAAIREYHHDPNKARDFLGHGTHVSGIIAAVVNNSVGIAGVANCRLHCWKIFDDPKRGSKEVDFNFEFYSDALASALDTDIKVINLSIGGTESSKTEATIFAELSDSGVIVVAAMGNHFDHGNPKVYPAGYDAPLAVGALDEALRRASFSNTGDHIGLLAPGVNILSTVPGQKARLADARDYDSWDGTSMATPYVAGVAALLYARKKKSKAAAGAIVKRLQSTARKLPEMQRKSFTKEHGSGLVDLFAALKTS